MEVQRQVVTALHIQGQVVDFLQLVTAEVMTVVFRTEAAVENGIPVVAAVKCIEPVVVVEEKHKLVMDGEMGMVVGGKVLNGVVVEDVLNKVVDGLEVVVRNKDTQVEGVKVVVVRMYEQVAMVYMMEVALELKVMAALGKMEMVVYMMEVQGNVMEVL